MTAPLISVVLPVCNNAATVESAARSVLRQTVRDLELIVVDDGSTDGSLAAVSHLRDPRVRVCRNERNLGVSRTRNRGLDLVRGAFMAPMDADDVCHPRRLERTLEVLQRSEGIGVCGGWARWRGWGRLPFVPRLPCAPPAVRAYLVYGAPFHHDTLLFRRAAYERHGLRYPEDVSAGEDFDLYCRCARTTGAQNVPSVLVDYRHNPEGLISTRAREGTAARLRCLREELLRLLPEGVDEAALRFHAAVGNGTGAETAEALERSRAWLQQLVDANGRRQAYDPRGLAAATAMVWFRVCRNSAHLGLTAWRAWRRSPWATYDRPTREELVSFLGSWVLSRVFPSRRKPQGQLRGL
jgi:hypothetical protein